MATTLRRIAVFVFASFVISGLAIFLQVSYFTITFQFLVFVIAFVWLFARLIKCARSMSRRLAWSGVAFVLFVPYLVITATGASVAINSLRLERFVAQFLNNPPVDSSLSLVQAQVGVLTGNGDHCDFIVEIEITSRLNRHAIAAHYAALPVRRAIAGESSEVVVAVDMIDDGVFMLNATDAPNDAAADIRCY